MPEADGDSGMQQIRDMLTRLDERGKGMEEKLDQVHHVLITGNGVPPLMVQVATLNTEVANLKAERRQGKGDRVAIWAALVTGGIGFIEMLVRHIL